MPLSLLTMSSKSLVLLYEQSVEFTSTVCCIIRSADVVKNAFDTLPVSYLKYQIIEVLKSNNLSSIVGMPCYTACIYYYLFTFASSLIIISGFLLLYSVFVTNKGL